MIRLVTAAINALKMQDDPVPPHSNASSKVEAPTTDGSETTIVNSPSCATATHQANENHAATHRDERKPSRTYSAAVSSSTRRIPINEDITDLQPARTPQGSQTPSRDGHSNNYTQSYSSTHRYANYLGEHRTSNVSGRGPTVSSNSSYRSDQRSEWHVLWDQMDDCNRAILRAEFHRRAATGGKELEGLKATVERCQRRENELLVSVQQERQRANALEHNFQSLLARHQETTELSKTRGMELKAAQTFLSKADLISPVDVIQMADTLNQEIFQLSAFISDSILSDATRVQDGDDSMRWDTTGALVNHVLVAREQCELGEQFVFQQVLVKVAADTMSKWSDVPEVNAFLEGVLGAMNVAEETSICGKWRALAHTYNPEIVDRNADESDILRAMKLGLLVATRNIGYLENPFDAIEAEVRNNYKDKLCAVASKIITLRDAIHRSVTSESIRVVVFEPGHDFLPSSMTNEYEGDVDPVEGDLVLATSAIGLVVERVAKVGDATATHWLLKPKVVLESLLKEL